MHHVEQLVGFTVGVGKCSNVCWMVLEEILQMLCGSVADDGERIARVIELVCSLSEVSSLLTTEQSTKVSNEHHDDGPRFPE